MVNLEAAKHMVGKGWHGILEEFYTKLNDLYPDVFPMQIKEKCGTLRIYFDHYTAESDRGVQALVIHAERASTHTCEVCGELGKLRTDGDWDITLCDECSTKDDMLS